MLLTFFLGLPISSACDCTQRSHLMHPIHKPILHSLVAHIVRVSVNLGLSLPSLRSLHALHWMPGVLCAASWCSFPAVFSRSGYACRCLCLAFPSYLC
jgi:hypothetical protein